jgi:gluconolactonase
MKTARVAIIATLAAFSCPARAAAQETGTVLRLDRGLDDLVAKDARIEKLAGGFQFTEGPLWRPDKNALWFSDVVGNVVRQWSPDGRVQVLIEKAGGDPGAHDGFVGPNGEAADKDGAVLIYQHTARRIVRFDANG